MRVAAIFVCVCLSACSSLAGKEYAVYDPGEEINRSTYNVTDRLDRAAIAPVAQGYQTITPDWLERGVINVFANVRTIGSAINGFLQAKPESGFTDLSRILVNSTIGVGGFFDVATRMDLRYQQEDFGQTLAVWGWHRSRYVYVPFLGPSTWRDLPSTIVRSAMPRLIVGPSYHWGLSGLDAVATRAALLTASEVRDATAIDPYAFTRDAYFQRRKFQIYDGAPPLDDFFDEFDEFEEDDALDF